MANQGFIHKDFELGGWGGEQDGSRMIIGAPPSPRRISNLDPLRLLLTQSGTNFPNNIFMTYTYVQ